MSWNVRELIKVVKQKEKPSDSLHTGHLCPRRTLLSHSYLPTEAQDHNQLWASIQKTCSAGFCRSPEIFPKTGRAGALMQVDKLENRPCLTLVLKCVVGNRLTSGQHQPPPMCPDASRIRSIPGKYDTGERSADLRTVQQLQENNEWCFACLPGHRPLLTYTSSESDVGSNESGQLDASETRDNRHSCSRRRVSAVRLWPRHPRGTFKASVNRAINSPASLPVCCSLACFGCAEI